MKHSVYWNEEAEAVIVEVVGGVSRGDVEEIITGVERYLSGRSYHYLIVDLAQSSASIPSDREYRRWLKEEYYRIGFDRIAIVNAPFGLRMLASGRRHIKFFVSQRDAIRWLA